MALGLTLVVEYAQKNTKKFKKKVSFGGCNLGGIRGKLSKKEIYEDFSGFSINEVWDLRSFSVANAMIVI